MQPKTFWVIVVGSLLTVISFGPLYLSLFRSTAVAIAVCSHLYFLGEIEQQEWL